MKALRWIARQIYDVTITLVIWVCGGAVIYYAPHLIHLIAHQP